MSEPTTVDARNPRLPGSYQELAKIIELPLIGSELSEEQVAQGCETARQYGMASVIVRPSDVDLAERWTRSAFVLGAVIDWPHGFSTTAVKQYAARDALRRGAKEITVAINTGKLVSRQFQYVEMELIQIAEACHEIGAFLTVSLESGYLTDEHKIVACRIAKRVSSDFIATPEPSDVALLREHGKGRIQIKLRGAGTLEAALNAFDAGCSRIETARGAEILDAWKVRLAAEAEAHAQK
ncbi:MAG TPA: hypothetical protein VKU01_36795 [Bryobacteraceae bacterium]|nr:hypothetical protein [Bryobacteraceae bacterium]